MTVTKGMLCYSLFNSLGYLAAGIIFYLEAKRKKYPMEQLFYVLFGSLAGGLIGSKLGSALFVYPEYFSKHMTDIFLPQIGGKTLVGGLLGGFAGVEITKKIIKFGRSTGDLFAPGIALAIAIGRFGCFFNGCCAGINGLPVQLFESVFCFFLFVYLWSIRKNINTESNLFKLFALFYSYFRFWIEFLRADKVILAYNLSIAQFVAAIVFLILAIYFLKKQKKGESYVK